MTQLVDTDGAAGPPPSDGLTLVGETKTFLKAWQRVLLSSAEWVPEEVAALRQQSRELEARARAADVSGLAHHLQSCEHCFWNGDVDKSKLAHCLRNVSEVAWQWRQDLRTRSDVLAVDGQGHVPTDRLTIEPPTLLTPPSVEMFESSPPPPEPAPEWHEAPPPPWMQPSLLQRWFGRAKREPSAGESPTRGTKRKGAFTFPSLAEGVYSVPDAAPDAEPESAPPEASSREAALSRRGGGFPWWSASLAALGVVGVGVLVSTHGGPRAEVASAASGTAASEAAKAREEQPALPRDVLERIVAGAHGHGGIESPELADLLDEEAAELARSGGVCADGATGCEMMRSAAATVARPWPKPRPSAGERASWLEGLALPELGAKDDRRVREAFELHTRNAVGRETFQELLFRCGVHRELMHAALARYGLPLELVALPMVVSGCIPDGEHQRGARGLWHLSPAAAKAYHLRVKAEVVDERIDPAKATDAAVRLLEDLHRKMGSWELAIAAYRLSPLALLSRLQGGGEDAGYWELEAAGGIPAEASGYVPKVQAFALILANLERLRFEPVPVHEPEVTAVLEVPPGTRLGVVARAAASSTTKIRELNPDVLGERVPDWPGEKFVLRVPKDAELRARDVLPALIATADHADECVPHAFDWGRQRFTNAMATRCEHASNR